MTFNKIRAQLTLGLSLLASMPALAQYDSSNFWLSPDAKQTNLSKLSPAAQKSNVFSQYVVKPSDTQKAVGGSDSVISSFAQTRIGQSNFAISSHYSEREHNSAIGGSYGGLSAFAYSGSGESYSRNNNHYAGLNPYAFHGGNLVDFRYSGAALGFALGDDAQIHIGETTVKSNRLEDRSSRFVDFSNRRFFTRYTQISRGTENMAYAVDAGWRYKQFEFGLQKLKNEFASKTERLRISWQQDSRNSFTMDFSNHNNRQLALNSDQSMMLSWHHQFGKKSPIMSLQGEPEKAEKPRGMNRGILIGGAAVAAAVLSSSGSSQQDAAVRTPVTSNSDSFTANIKAQHDAARSRFNIINPRSVRENKEYGGYVYQTADGSYATTNPVPGDESSVALPLVADAIPAGTRGRASYHTHAGPDPRFDSENFSEADLEGDRLDKLDGYLATPMGAFKYHEVSTGSIETLGTVNN